MSKKFSNKPLINNMAFIRKQLGFTQERLSIETGLTRQYISLLERGIHEPSLIDAWKICLILRTYPANIFTGLFDKAMEWRENKEKEVKDNE